MQAKGKISLPSPSVGVAVNDDVRMEPAILAQRHVLADDAIRPDDASRANPRLRINHRRRINHLFSSTFTKARAVRKPPIRRVVGNFVNTPIASSINSLIERMRHPQMRN